MFWPTVVLPGIITNAMFAYPFLEAKALKDKRFHNITQRPRDAPFRTALGAAGVTFFLVLTFSGANDIIANTFDISLNATTWAGRILVILGPAIAYFVTYRICLGLQQHDRLVLAHGVETGIIRRLPDGKFVEVHQPLGPVDEHGHGTLEYSGAPVPKKMNRLGALPPAIRGFFVPIERPAESKPDGHRDSEAEAEAIEKQ
jgi:ubiquinol-cytochrome c reductase cytochrome b subunit